MYRGKTKYVVAVAVAKLIAVIVLSLGFTRWWSYSGSQYNNDVVDSCSSTELDVCGTFCDHNSTLTLVTTNDDVYHHHFTTEGYCTAELTQSCAYDYWMIFRLVPIVMHIVQFMLQWICWYKFRNFVPQFVQFELISNYLLIDHVEDSPTESSSASTNVSSSFNELMSELYKPPFYSVFAFIELMTALYVWSELYFPPINCTSVIPLSYYYYPLLMTMLEMGKLNVYLSLRQIRNKNGYQAVFLVFNAKVFFFNFVITCMLGLAFLPNILYSCLYEDSTPINCERADSVATPACHVHSISLNPVWPQKQSDIPDEVNIVNNGGITGMSIDMEESHA